MKKIFYIVMACCAICSCTIAEGIDDPTGGDESYTEILIFENLILEDDYATLTTAEQIQKAVEQIEEGGAIEFADKEYDLTSDITIYKGVTLKGVGETPTPDESETEINELAGAGDISTIFNFSKSDTEFTIYGDNVKFQNLKITVDSDTIVNFKGFVHGFETENVHFYGSTYQLSPRNTMVEGVKCSYTTFDNFYFRAFFVNISHSVDYDGETIDTIETVESCDFYRCHFTPEEKGKPNARAISYDAGNTEVPIILDFDGSEIRECYFDDIGFASSKCQNFHIIDCEFYVSVIDDFPIHLEEYTCNSSVKGCLFTCHNAEESMIGVMDHSSIENNTVTGNCYGFISGEFAEHLTISGNDLSKMTNTKSSNPRAISIWGSKNGSRHITVKDNTITTNSSADYDIRVQATSEYTSTIDIASNIGATYIVKECTGYTYPITDGATGRIKHIDSGEYLSAADTEADIALTTSADDSTLWEFTHVWPNRYEVKSVKYGSYLFILEDTEGYKDEDMTTTVISPKTKSFGTTARKPIWDLTTMTSGNIVGPGGGNDGTLCISSNTLKLMKVDNRDAVTDSECLWTFEITE